MLTQYTVTGDVMIDFLKSCADKKAEAVENMINEAKEVGANYLTIAYSSTSPNLKKGGTYTFIFSLRLLATLEQPTDDKLKEFANGERLLFLDLKNCKVPRSKLKETGGHTAKFLKHYIKYIKKRKKRCKAFYSNFITYMGEETKSFLREIIKNN